MDGYKGKDNATPRISETPELRGSRYKEELRLHQKSVKDLQDEARKEQHHIKTLGEAIVTKQAEFDAMVMENNNKLQAIQSDIRTAGDDLVIDKAELDERVKKVEAYVKERFASMYKTSENNRIDKERLRRVEAEQAEKSADLELLGETLAKRQADAEACERSIKISLREANALTERTKQEALDLKERNDHINENSIRVDTKHTENANESIRITKRTEELNALIKTQTIIKEEFDRIQKLVADTEKTMADFNSQRDWIAARNAELVTYERALRIKDSQIQEREGKVKQAEVRISGG